MAQEEQTVTRFKTLLRKENWGAIWRKEDTHVHDIKNGTITKFYLTGK